MFLPSLANIANAFDADYALINLSIAGYAGMTAIVQLIAGPLSDRFGRRPVMLGALGIFILASLGCFLAEDVWVFLGFRLLQSAVISGYAISMAVVRDTNTTEKSASLISYITAVSAIAPMIGPVIGGTLDELFGWRSSFAAFAVMGVAMLAICWIDLQETNSQNSSIKASRLSVYGELVQSRRFWGYSLCMAFCNGSFYVFLGGVPLVAKSVFEVSTAELGFYMGTITVGFIIGSLITGRLITKHALTTMMLAGRLVACIGLSIGLVAWFSGYTSIFLYFLSCASVGAGNGLTLSPSSVGAMSVRPQLAGSAAGLNGALAVALGSVMSAISGTMLTETNAAYGVLSLMLVSSGMGLISALYVMWIDRKVTNQNPSR